MTTAFVLSGGGSLGAVQVGMLQALLRWGARPDLVVGTSVGAVNGAWVAGHPGTAGPDGLASVWRGLRRADVFPSSPSRALAAVTGRSRVRSCPRTGCATCSLSTFSSSGWKTRRYHCTSPWPTSSPGRMCCSPPGPPWMR